MKIPLSQKLYNKKQECVSDLVELSPVHFKITRTSSANAATYASIKLAHPLLHLDPATPYEHLISAK